MAMEKKVLLIEGMTCSNCQNRIEQALRNTAGISKVNVSYNNGQAEVEFDKEILTLEQIIHIIQDLDYTVVQRRKIDYKKTVSSIGTFAIIICLYYLLQHGQEYLVRFLLQSMVILPVVCIYQIYL